MLSRVPAVFLVLALVSAAPALAQPDRDAKSSRIPITPRVEKDEPKGLPPVFSELSLADALAKNTGDTLLIVKFTAEWCGPCKMMDRTTWRDQRVVDWVRANGMAIQVDVDKRPDDAKAHSISAMPTTIVFKDGKPISRRVGYLTPDPMLTFLASAKNPGQGEHEAQVKPGAGAQVVTPQVRLQATRQLVDNGKFDEATKEYVWLWQHMLEQDPAMYGVRRSFMIGDMKRLASMHQPSVAAFAAIRDETEARLKGQDKSFEDLMDWIALNQATSQEEKTLAWFDRIKGQPDVTPTFGRVGFMLQQILIDKGRWADLALIWPDPIAQLKREHEMWSTIPRMGGDPERQAEMDRLHREHFRSSAAQIYVSQLAAQKLDQSQAVANNAIKLDDTPELRIALVKQAIKAGVARPEHEAMLKSVQRPDNAPAVSAELERLKSELDAALAKNAG